jgi:hypothetical protein
MKCQKRHDFFFSFAYGASIIAAAVEVRRSSGIGVMGTTNVVFDGVNATLSVLEINRCVSCGVVNCGLTFFIGPEIIRTVFSGV